MFDDNGGFDGIVRSLVLVAATVNLLALLVVAWLLSGIARKLGRRGGLVAGFLVLIGVEVMMWLLYQSGASDATVALALALVVSGASATGGLVLLRRPPLPEQAVGVDRRL
jgi:Na+/melibiose symporter-like transporter